MIAENTKKLRKPKPWKHNQPITHTHLKQMRDEFWDTAPHYGGQKETFTAIVGNNNNYMLNGRIINEKHVYDTFVILTISIKHHKFQTIHLTLAEIWDALRAAAEADLDLAQAIVDSAGIIISNADMTLCYDERGENNLLSCLSDTHFDYCMCKILPLLQVQNMNYQSMF
ncbi:hypothetical protein BHE74_00044183 [Ensete ventricosum]|nr:hypothetical protein BHE74_00044183 [Ensete ventricosum]